MMRALQPTRPNCRRRFLLATATALLLALAGPAIAQRGGETKGEGFLEGRDDAAQTLQIEDVLVRVTDDTRIYNGDGQRISFAKIPALEDATLIVEYSGRAAGKAQLIAERLVVRVQPR